MSRIVPSWLNWYKKPSYVDLKVFAESLKTRTEEKYGDRASSRNSYSSLKSEESVPKDLTLERVLANKTCSPMSLYDFYMYLKHIEYSQENLEFYMWYKDYEKRYRKEQAKNAELKKHAVVEIVPLPDIDVDTSLSKEIFQTSEEKLLVPSDSNIAPGFVSYIEALVLHEAARYPRPCCTTFLEPSADCKLETPSSQQHEELQNIIALFLTTGSPKELNIPPSMRKLALQSLQSSNSPEHLSHIADHVYALLRYGSHRNFVRLGVNNGTFETLCMVTFVGITMSVTGFLTMFLIAFASPSIHNSERWRGLATIPFWFIGLSFLLAGMRGSCFLLLLFSRRQELPWERVDEGQSVTTTTEKSAGNGVTRFTKKLMIFERKIRVRDMGLRRLQRKIVIQSVVGAFFGTAILEVAFLCLPIWRRSQ